MKDKIAYIHHNEFIHLKCCYRNLYDAKLRMDYHHYLNLMKKHPMTHEQTFVQQISYFLHQIHYFIFEIDLEILRESFESMKIAYDKLIELEANAILLDDYRLILTGLQKSLIDKGHLDSYI